MTAHDLDSRDLHLLAAQLLVLADLQETLELRQADLEISRTLALTADGAEAADLRRRDLEISAALARDAEEVEAMTRRLDAELTRLGLEIGEDHTLVRTRPCGRP